MARSCPFCAQPAQSVEHVIPLWMSQRFLKTASKTAYFTLRHDGVDQRKTRSMNQKVKVCANCNNVWMSRLEQAAKPLLEGLADDQLEELSESDQEILAKWLFKTAIIHEFLGTAHRPTSTYQQRVELRNGQIPMTWSAHIAHADKFPGEALVHNPGPVANYTDDDGVHRGSARLITTRFGHMAAQILVHNLDEKPSFSELLGGDVFSAQIWPTKGSVRWPPGRSLTLEGFDIVCTMQSPSSNGLSL